MKIHTKLLEKCRILLIFCDDPLKVQLIGFLNIYFIQTSEAFLNNLSDLRIFK